MFRLSIGVLAVLLVAACAEKRMPLTSVAEVRPTGLGMQGEFVRQRGSQIVEVRTFMKRPKTEEELAQEDATTAEADTGGPVDTTNEIEFGGATCVLRGDRFAAEVTTPAGVRVPLYGYRSGALTLECAKDGFKPGIAVVETYNKTFAERRAGAAGGGLLGALFIELVNAASDETNDEFEYIFTPVFLEEVAAQSS